MFASVLSASAGVAIPAPQPVQSAPSAERVGAFADAMARQGAEGAAQTDTVGPASNTNVTNVSETNGVDAESRARQGLDLEGAAKIEGKGGGDMILDGIQRMRHVFDVREAHIGELMKGKVTDANSLMAMQMEVVNFTLLVDVSSKLTGKATQSFDTLMKGS